MAALGRSLDRVLGGVLDLLGRETGETEACAQAKREWGLLLASEYDYAGIAARRAALLFALHALAPVRAHFAKREPELVADLEARVLPATIPSFLSGMAQRPEALVVMCSTLTSMWQRGHGGEGVAWRELRVRGVRACKKPLASCTSDAIEKAEAPPPLGSHATKTWLMLASGSRMS